MSNAVTTRRDPTHRNVFLLAACQGLAMSGSSMLAAVAALAGYMIADDKSLATLPVACQFLATMLSTIPASLIMRRIGRRAGFTIGQMFGMTGAAIAGYAIYDINFPLFIAGSFCIGVHNAFWQYYRFAAADTASEAFRARSISYVLAGGIVAAIVGPEVAKLTVDLFEPVKFAGSYAAFVIIVLIAISVLQFIEIPTATASERRDSGRPLGEIARQPKFAVAVLSSMLGYAVMAMVMTATPLAMAVCGHAFNDTAFVIEWHMLGMFAPSFFMGHLISRFGALNIIMIGVGLMIASLLTGLSGISVVQFWGALVLLGLGWNCMFVGGTSLLTETYRPAERAKAQALNDFLVFTAVAIGSFSSGAIQHQLGWDWINLAMVPPMLVVFLAVIWLRYMRRQSAAA
ncbi:MAG: MFS transporter [Alphaproteobacteria bacterium]|nr:MFS transporter [Alphaproteobacteria bacterium]